MKIEENFSLQKLNTFGIDAKARYFAPFANVNELMELLSMPTIAQRPMVLGGGSNILFTKNWDGSILYNQLRGIEVLEQNEDEVLINAGAGENWHRVVQFAVENNWGGIENLSLIPGSIGAGPMQNIGAYGVEIKDSFLSLQAFHIQDKVMVDFSLADCKFAYRESVFKNKFKGQFIICAVTLKLKKNPVLNTSYGAIEAELNKRNILYPNVKDVSEAVIAIRQSKLPDPKQIGNAGSFFKNPEISLEQLEGIKEKFPHVIAYPSPKGAKLAAGWLIEQCGWKGYTEGNFGVHKLQALVLVNYGGASGQQIFELSNRIIAAVNDKFGITLEREVNIV